MEKKSLERPTHAQRPAISILFSEMRQWELNKAYMRGGILSLAQYKCISVQDLFYRNLWNLTALKWDLSTWEYYQEEQKYPLMQWQEPLMMLGLFKSIY